MVTFSLIQPPNVIAGFIRHFWTLEGSASKDNPFIHRALADSCPEFLFYYKGKFSRIFHNTDIEKCFTSGIYGQKQSYDQFSVNENFGIFGVNLYPYSIKQLFSFPTSELSDHCPDIKTLCGLDGEILEEKVVLAASNAQRTQLVTDFFIRRLAAVNNEYSNIVTAIRNIISFNNSNQVNKLANDCNLSRRQFERKFREYSGFSPRVFLNIARFGHSIKNNLNTVKSLTEIAHECGYYDQSHFIRDFRKFSGYSPKEYFKSALETDYRATTEFQV